MGCKADSIELLTVCLHKIHIYLRVGDVVTTNDKEGTFSSKTDTSREEMAHISLTCSNTSACLSRLSSSVPKCSLQCPHDQTHSHSSFAVEALSRISHGFAMRYVTLKSSGSKTVAVEWDDCVASSLSFRCVSW